MVSIYRTYIVDNDNVSSYTGDIEYTMKFSSEDTLIVNLKKKIHIGEDVIDEEI